MERNGRPRRRPEAPSAPPTLHEITRRYVATALALARAMGLPLTETFMREHRESISCCFIEAGRAGVRLPSGVQLPPLADAPVRVTTTPPANGHDHAEPVTDGVTTVTTPNGHPVVLREERPLADPSTNGSVAKNATAVASPTTIPTDAGLPCGGALIVNLTPPQLHMLVSKVGFRMLAEPTYAPLLHALQAERAARLARGKRRKGPPEMSTIVDTEGAADVP
jgi:hypothetical protein